MVIWHTPATIVVSLDISGNNGLLFPCDLTEEQVRRRAQPHPTSMRIERVVQKCVVGSGKVARSLYKEQISINRSVTSLLCP